MEADVIRDRAHSASGFGSEIVVAWGVKDALQNERKRSVVELAPAGVSYCAVR